MRKLFNFMTRLLIRAQMRETARRIEATRAAIANIPARKQAAENALAAMHEALDEEEKLLQEDLDELWKRAASLREEDFWIGRPRHRPFSYSSHLSQHNSARPAVVKDSDHE